MKINWYPGHMKKARDKIEENIKKVDVVVELLDARIPVSSMNPVIGSLAEGKLRLVLLNKSDLADAASVEEWVAYFKGQGITAVPINAVSGNGAHIMMHELKKLSHPLVQRRRASNKFERSVRVMVVGVPNVGKSTLINTIIGKQQAKTGKTPGVTREQQWIRIHEDFDLLDTPGILWPQTDSPDTMVHLALTGAIKDEVADVEELAYVLIEIVAAQYPEVLKERYGIEDISEDPMTTIEAIAKRRGCLRKGNTYDYIRVAKLILEEYRKGLYGTIALERPGGGTGKKC